MGNGRGEHDACDDACALNACGANGEPCAVGVPCDGATALRAAIDRMISACPNALCYEFVAADENRVRVTWRELRDGALAYAARQNGSKGDSRISVSAASDVPAPASGSASASDLATALPFVVLDSPNSVAYPQIVLASAYGGRTVVALNNRLAAPEKAARLEIAREAGDRLAQAAVVMFTSGTTGTPKAVPLTWSNLVGSARAANEALGGDAPDALWQATLPLYHVGGLQIVVRSLLAGRPFLLYERFDAARVLCDARDRGATHLSVVDKTLRDLLDAAGAAAAANAADGAAVPGGADAAYAADGAASSAAQTLGSYRCVLLGGAAANPQTLARARARGVNVYASYGMTETSSAVAAAPIACSTQPGDTPALSFLPGYRAHILDADDQGFGTLAIEGPGVVDGYANASCPRTAEGYFITGDTAALVDGGKLVVRERVSDMFVSGGENVYPEEIRRVLLSAPGVADAAVIGVADSTWGRRPVAFVERDATDAGQSPCLTAQVRAATERGLSRISRPGCVIAFDEFPRSGIGKTDRRVLEAAYEQRIDVVDVRLHRVTLPFVRPFSTAQSTLYDRTVIVVEVRDGAGRTGVGECSSFGTDWYLPETLGEDERVLRDVLAPYVRAEAFAHPADAYAAFAAIPDAAAYPFARAAMEMALWDLYGAIVRKPLWQLIGGEGHGGDRGVAVPVGAVVGLAPIDETPCQVRALAAEGYRRVKLKVAPRMNAVARVRAVREAFPDIAVSLDANQSFSTDDLAELRELDALGCTWIEEPLSFEGSAANQRDPRAARDRFDRLARLQRELATPLCLDESFVTIDDARAALEHPELRCFALKIGKFGGIAGACAFAREALAAGARVWMGGMYDTGISKRAHAAFETLSGIDDPGDLGTVARYFGCDIANPPHAAFAGRVLLNDDAHPYGIGCDFDCAGIDADQVRSECG